MLCSISFFLGTRLSTRAFGGIERASTTLVAVIYFVPLGVLQGMPLLRNR